eukprot:Gb_34507 [translate_table: standard]
MLDVGTFLDDEPSDEDSKSISSGLIKTGPNKGSGHLGQHYFSTLGCRREQRLTRTRDDKSTTASGIVVASVTDASKVGMIDKKALTIDDFLTSTLAGLGFLHTLDDISLLFPKDPCMLRQVDVTAYLIRDSDSTFRDLASVALLAIFMISATTSSI